MAVSTTFDKTNQLYGRRVITTHRVFTGDANQDVQTAKLVLKETLDIHKKNAEEETKLFNIFFNDSSFSEKEKQQRSDINNQIGIPNAYAITRTINGYCFGEPTKYLARETGDGAGKQILVEKLSEMFDYQHNHDSTIMATTSASICGLGYKLAMPADDEELALTGIPFVINNEFIYPQNAFVVKSNTAIPTDIMAVLIGTFVTEENGELKETPQYTVWTKNWQFVFIEDSDDDTGYKLNNQVDANGNEFDTYPRNNPILPLIEVERNPFRKGDWEVAVDLLSIKNKLLSDRADDVDQAIDYVLVLMNCAFESDDDKANALTQRLFSLKVTDPMNKPSIEILRNALDQTGIQTYCDYVDLLIQECVGIPNRQERGGGGGDTGAAVKYRNGFRDLENNAGIIIPKMDKAELRFIALCLGYANNVTGNQLAGLMPYDVRCKFLRTLSDDIVSSSQAFLNYANGGLAYTDALLLSKSGTDPSEIAGNAREAFARGETLIQRQAEIKASETTTTTETAGGTTPTAQPVTETGENS